MVGSLAELLYGKARGTLLERQWNDKRKLAVASDVVNGVAFLHSRRVAHRDLKSHNVLYDRDLRIKLCDMGVSAVKAKAAQSVQFESCVGTPAWMAPEVPQRHYMAQPLAVTVWRLCGGAEGPAMLGGAQRRALLAARGRLVAGRHPLGDRAARGAVGGAGVRGRAAIRHCYLLFT